MTPLSRAILFSMVLSTAALPVQAVEAVDVSSHPWIGKDAPGFELERLDGTPLSLEQLKGKYVVIHFGASW